MLQTINSNTMTTLLQQKSPLKQFPKKSTLINNLLNREDNLSISVVTHGEQSILLQLIEKSGVRHIKASKDMLSLLSKEELASLMESNKVVKNWNISGFILDRKSVV